MNPLLTLFVATPVLIFAVVALLPRGRAGLLTSGAVLVLAALAWFLGDGASISLALAPMAVAALTLAWGVRLIRRRLPDDVSRYAYPSLVGLLALGFGGMIIQVLGV